MKKYILILTLSLIVPASLAVFPERVSAQSDDLAIGDPLTPGWKRSGKKRTVKKATPATPSEGAMPAEPAKSGEPAKAAEPAKPATPAEPASK